MCEHPFLPITVLVWDNAHKETDFLQSLYKINGNAVSGSPKPQEPSQISAYNVARLPLPHKINVHMLS